MAAERVVVTGRLVRAEREDIFGIVAICFWGGIGEDEV